MVISVKHTPGSPVSEDYSVTVAGTIEEVERLRSVWEDFHWHPNGDIDNFLTVIRAYGEKMKPYVVLLKRGDKPEAMLAGRLEDTRLMCSVGYRIVVQPRVRSLTVVYGGVMGNTSYPHAVLLIETLRTALSRGEADMVCFNHLDLESDMYRVATKTPGFLWRQNILKPNVHWKLSIPGSFDGFYRNLTKHTRKNIRNVHNRMEKKFGNALMIRHFREKEEVDQFIDDAEMIASKTYQRGFAGSFGDSRETRLRMLHAAERQWLRAYILYLDGHPVSYAYGLQYGNTFFGGSTGFDPAYRNCSPGFFLFMKMIENLCEEENTEALDFGFGDAEYKQRICDQNWEEAPVYIFSANIHGMKLNAIFSLTQAVSKIAGGILDRFRLVQKVKRSWRNRLGPGGAQSRKSS